MRSYRIRGTLFHALSLMILITCPVAAAEVKDHKAISRYPGSTPTSRADDGFISYTVITGVHADKKTDEERFDTIVVDGNFTGINYENPKGRSALEIYTNYREALEKAGFSILFHCAEAECGPGFATSAWGRITGGRLKYFTPEMQYVAAKGKADGNEIYVVALIAKLRHQIQIVEMKPMERGLVTAQAIEQGLTLEGRVVLEGLFFDHDKAVLTPESKPALEVIAKYLKGHADLNVYIVGHTDGTGSFEYNLGLSKQRAEAVVNALAKDYGIAASRLSAHGVGPLAPEKTNQNEGGREENRRVEMVAR